MVRVVLFAVLGLAAAGLNPITRVAQLLDDMSAKVKADGEHEQELYDGFKCWCKKVTEGKGASIEENKVRIEQLANRIDDLSSGRVTLTSEEGDLTKEIKQLEAGIKEATDMRAKELEDFTAAKLELDQSITALEGAVSTMSTATEDHPASMMLTTFHKQLKKVAKVGAGFMTQSDLDAFKRILQVPKRDEGKLNSEATHLKKYEHRSGEIQNILGEMLQTFKDNRDEAVAAEGTASTTSAALLVSKRGSLSDAQDAMRNKNTENAARDAAKATANSEKTDLETQNTNDERFIGEATTTCATKATEWAARKELRAGEQAAIAQAIATLRSDDSRDLFKKSFDSQSFLQTRIRPHHSRKQRANRNKAALVMRHTAAKSGDLRLAKLAAKVEGEPEGAPTDFTAVTASLQTMINDLNAEEASDAATKKMCTEERMAGNKNIADLSRQIDSETAFIERYDKQMAAATKRIEEITQEIQDLADNKAAATTQRNKENAEFIQATQDDNAAVGVVETAKNVLKDFYADRSLTVLVQAPGAGGDAPTPPPSTWDTAEYGGATGEAGGIIQMMEAIKDDINKDIAKAAADEETALNAFNSMCDDIDASTGSLQITRNDLNSAKGEDTESRADEKTSRTTNQGLVNSKLQFLKGIANGCDYMMKNFEMRLTNRQAELDGLDKAKAIFGGAHD